MNKNKTVIDFIEEQIEDYNEWITRKDVIEIRRENLEKLILEAKELHKKEMIDFASKMRKVNEIYYDKDGAAKIEFRFNIEEYYKENYE